MYIKITDGIPASYNAEQVRVDYPGTSFPATLTDATLAEFGVYPCQETMQPTYDYTKTVVEMFEQTAKGWVQVWQVIDASAEEIAQRTEEKAASVRQERNGRLVATDWTQVADAPVDKTAWASYRQQLRDISAQPGFPWDVIWPQEP